MRPRKLVTTPSCLSKHTVVCRAAKKTGNHTVSIFTGRKKTAFSCIVPWLLLQNTPFLLDSCPPSRVRHTANLIKFATAICKIWVFNLISWFFSSYAVRGAMGPSISFRTLCKIAIKYKLVTGLPRSLAQMKSV